MNFWIQLGLGLLVSNIVIWLFIILKKKKQIKGYIYAGLMTALCLTAFGYGFFSPKEEVAAPVELSKEELISFAYSFAGAGEYNQVEELVKQYSDEYGYDDECRLVAARVSALLGDYEAASGLYARLSDNASFKEKIKKEYEYTKAKSEADLSALGMYSYLEKNGYNPEDYGYSKEKIEATKASLEITADIINETILKQIDKSYKNKKYEKVMESVAAANATYGLYAASGIQYLSEEELEELEDVKKDLEKVIKKTEGLASCAFVRNAMLKLNLLMGEYDDIAENIDDNATIEEVTVASTLLMNGVVKERDFSDSFAAEYLKYGAIVGGQLEEIQSEYGDELTSVQASELENMVEYWDDELDNPVLTQLRNNLKEAIEKDTGNAKESKMHMEIAQIEHFYGNESNRTDSITAALDTGYRSEDTSYREAIEKINNIISSDVVTNEIMNADSYVAQALQNAMPMEVYNLIPEKKEEAHGDLPGMETGGIFGGSGEQNNTSSQKKEQEFSQAFIEYVSEVKSSLVIGAIDTDEFDTVKVYVSISSDYAKDSEALKELLEVYDCGASITDYTIEKVKYDSIKTHLLCDMSGSMSGSMGDLKNAVISYVNMRGRDEEIAVSTFSDAVESTARFGTNDEQLIEFANGFHTTGGTQIFYSLMDVLNSFPAEENSHNVVILMTDGGDNSYHSNEELIREVGGVSDSKSITVYTLGLGSVEPAYLTTIATSGNGEFIYVSDSNSLDNFYQLMHSQVDNRYVLTFKAKDTMTLTDRTLEIRLNDANLSDYKVYSLPTNDDESAEGDAGTGSNDSYDHGNYEDGNAPGVNTLSVTGLSKKVIYQSDFDSVDYLLGSGFTPESSVRITFTSGELKYDILPKYVSETEFSMLIPAKMPAGVYDMQVRLDGESAYITNALQIVTETNQEITFGPYSFEASYVAEVSENKWVLSGSVIMNDWLNFKGDVVIEGDLDVAASITVTDKSGSFVTFDEDTAIGLGKEFARDNIKVNVPKLGTFSLHYDQAHLYNFDDYKVDEIYTTGMQIARLLQFDSVALSLYPDRMEIAYSETHMDFPSLEDVFDIKDEIKLFEFELDGKGILNSENIGIEIEFDGESDVEQYKQMNMLNAPVFFDTGELKVKVNTFSEEYEFGGKVKFSFLDFGIGASIGFKGRTADKFSLTVDKEVTTTMGGVPITFGDFTLGASDIADAIRTKNFLAIKIEGSLDISACDVTAIFPELKKYIGDVSLLSMDDTGFVLDLQPLCFSATATLDLFEKIQLMAVNMNVGTFDYEGTTLLDIYGQQVSGIEITIEKGIEWEIKNVNVDITSQVDFIAVNRFFGVGINNATLSIDIKWWILPSIGTDLHGDAIMGLQFLENGDPQFVLIMSYQDGKKRVVKSFYIDKNGKTSDSTKKYS